MRLQDVYRLEEADLADGNVEGGPHLGIRLDWFDCFTIGKKAYEEGDFKRSYEWMNIIYHNPNYQLPSNQRVTVLDYLAFSAYKVFNIE